ncbi:MAG: glycoside hydrolase [Clostridia bacterium]|nr:glycoside hydrolase [Clostridia bacterium]
MWYLDIMEDNLTESDRNRLSKIWAPVTVGVQPDDSRRGLCVMPDGEIRYYGVEGKSHCWDKDGISVYLSSYNGLDWARKEGPAGSAPVINTGTVQNGTLAMGAAARLPWSGRYVTAVNFTDEERRGTWAMLSDIGPGDPAPVMVKICDEVCGDLFQPVLLEDRKRLLVSTYVNQNGDYFPRVLISDDDGEHWKTVLINPTPKHIPVFPHRGIRWQNNGSEPNLAELPDGRLMLLARTSLDYFYVYYSQDHGDSWDEGSPSIFHGTLTTPYLLKLSDGRVICFWNNTRPMAEPDHDRTWPPVSDYVKEGRGEDAFTNRDIDHAALTSDGVFGEGFRDVGRNEIRGASDFRVRGGSTSSADKSVHQFQALELPMGKVLVAYGQNSISRRMAVFDVNWLYEKSNSEDFGLGMGHISTHLFVKSLSDSHLGKGFNGHCAWNRTDGALLVPDPDCTGGEVLQICRVKDSRLVSDRQGMAWNFPATKNGILKLQIRIEGSGVRVRLCDHWINPGDEYVGLYAAYDFELDARSLPTGTWCDVKIAFTDGYAKIFTGDKLLFQAAQKLDVPCGISYLHLQTMAEETDFLGTLIRRMEFCAE